jgi:hypothetical protein
VAGEENKGWVWFKELFAKVKKEGEVPLDFKDLSLDAAAKARGIEEESVIFPFPFDFTAEEFDGIVNDPTDGGLFEFVKGAIFTGPVYHPFGSIEMANGMPFFGKEEGGCSRVSEEVENFFTWLEFGIHPIPMLGMFGEKAKMPKIGRNDFEGKVFVVKGP